MLVVEVGCDKRAMDVVVVVVVVVVVAVAVAVIEFLINLIFINRSF